MPSLSDDKINEIAKALYKLTLDLMATEDITSLNDITEIMNRVKMNTIYAGIKGGGETMTVDLFDGVRQYDFNSTANGWAFIKEKLFER